MSINFNKSTGNEIKSSAHSKYRCQYHIVFAPKYRRKEIYGQIRKDIGDIKKTVCTKRGGNNRSRGMSGPHPYASKYSTTYKCSTIYGISQGKKYIDDI